MCNAVVAQRLAELAGERGSRTERVLRCAHPGPVAGNRMKGAFRMERYMWLEVVARGKMEDYNPSFKSPLYPWMQIVGIAVSVIFISMMGSFPLMMVGAFLAFSIVWYLTYARGRKKRDYALQCVIERIKGSKDITECLDDEAMEADAEEDGGDTS